MRMHWVMLRGPLRSWMEFADVGNPASVDSYADRPCWLAVQRMPGMGPAAGGRGPGGPMGSGPGMFPMGGANPMFYQAQANGMGGRGGGFGYPQVGSGCLSSPHPPAPCREDAAAAHASIASGAALMADMTTNIQTASTSRGIASA